jgi:SSS family solute:Na+ symporter
MLILFVGILLCSAYAVADAGGLEAVLRAFPEDRFRAIEATSGLGDGGTAPFWAFLVGGFFLYASYYGTDQSQVQRELSAPSADETRFSLLFNGFARFPLTLLYAFMGVAVAAVYASSPELRAGVPADNPDYLLPRFILLYLPSGVRALIFAAILASAMSSLDSALNSLSAATMRDFIHPWFNPSRGTLLLSKLTTVSWGILITAFAFLVGAISETIIESINMLGSAFYGPILAAFVMGVLSRRATGAGVVCGILAGVGLNLVLWLWFPGVHWMWWNCFGCLMAAAVSLVVSLVAGPPHPEKSARYLLRGTRFLREERRWLPACIALIAYFFLILAVISLL